MEWFVLHLLFAAWQWIESIDSAFFLGLYERFLELIMLALAVIQVIQGKIKP